MYTYSIGATLLVPVFLASMSAASLTDCIPSQDEGDFTAAKLECRLPDGQQPKFPDDNHKTCHRTCITEIFFGLEICTACITDVNNEPIEVVAPQDSELQNIFTNRVILSPNFPNEFYPESILCRYIVQCDKEQLLWYYITDHDLQGRVIDPINNNQPTCVDFLCINRTAYEAGCQQTCGDFTTIEDDNADYNDDRLSVLFHTNRNRQNRGFFMVVTCVSPDFSHVNGCTPAQLGQTAAPSGGGRRKRVTEMASSQ